MSSDPMSIWEVLRRLAGESRGAEPGNPEGVGEGPDVRLAVYDSPLTAPRVIPLAAADLNSLVGELATQAYHSARERGGRIPFVVIREVTENLIHAVFRNAVISIFDDGNTIRISDQGPGIRDKHRALLPGFTTATREMRRFIRGVGSGLPLAREQLAFLGGTLTIEDNLERGTVVTLSLTKEPQTSPAGRPGHHPTRPDLSSRQKKTMLLVGELGSAGPTVIARELEISHSTAYRDLVALEAMRLVQHKGNGKRTLTEDGIAYLEGVFT